MTSSTSFNLRVVVAVPGVGRVVAVRNRSVTAALDPSGGVDLDCNGTPDGVPPGSIAIPRLIRPGSS